MFFSTGDGKEPKPSTSSSIQWSQPCRHIEFHEILAATQNFDESLVIGRGGFGKVYKGNVINEGSLVVAAIKRLDPESSQGPIEFWAEVKMLCMLRHRNIVSLIGYCIHEQEKILVYEYMPNGTLDYHLHKRVTRLSWVRRLNICVGAGHGLRYLHNDVGIHSGVIHRDFKSSNILLHESWTAKISDFGLSKTCPTNQPSTHVSTLIKGSFGYLDPNYYETGKLTRKSDVYAFGVLLLEVLCRKRALDECLYGEGRNLVAWAKDSIKEGNLKHIIDSDIKGEISPKCLKKFVSITERCLLKDPDPRPTIADVVASLETTLALQEKFNTQAASSRTIFGRMVDMLPFTSNGEYSVQVPSNSSKGNNNLQEMNYDADSESPSQSVKGYKFPDLESVKGYKFPDLESVKGYKFADLEKATRMFSPDLLLGEGGFGKVFLGWVDQNTLAPSEKGIGVAVAVKRLNEKGFQGHTEWLMEANFLEQLAHPNIIRLVGYCRDQQEHLLVYEYMPKKSFDRFLFTDGPDIAEPLSWRKRLLIMIGVARGLAYLHLKNIIHRALKSSNILLDEDFNVKLGNFGLAKNGPENGETHITTRVMGNPGYMDPEYLKTSHLSMKSDIYGFGVVLLESISGQRVVDVNRPEEQQNLVRWATQIQSNRRNVKEIMDPRLQHNYPLQGDSECFALALRCVKRKAKDRPSSEEVLQTLEHIHSLHS